MVYTCGKAKYSKSRWAIGKVGGAAHPPLSWSAPPTFHLALLSVVSTRLDKSVYFLLGETVNTGYSFKSDLKPDHNFRNHLK